MENKTKGMVMIVIGVMLLILIFKIALTTGIIDIKEELKKINVTPQEAVKFFLIMFGVISYFLIMLGILYLSGQLDPVTPWGEY